MERSQKGEIHQRKRYLRSWGVSVFSPSGKEKPIVDREVGTRGAHGYVGWSKKVPRRTNRRRSRRYREVEVQKSGKKGRSGAV